MHAAASRPHNRMQELRQLLVRRIGRLAGNEGPMTTAVPGLLLVRRTAPTAPMPACYEPSLALVVQGRKQLFLPGRTLTYDASRFLITSMDLPVLGQVTEASPDLPYLCLLLRLEMPIVREILARGELSAPEPVEAVEAMAVGETTEELLDACCRLVGLLEHPGDIPFLAELLQREIIYRILQTRAGAKLREIATVGSHSQRIARVVEWLRTHYPQPIRVEDLARMAAMGVSTFHHHFRELTSMSPLQYIKHVRLQAARQRMLGEGLDASSAAYAVGYQSVSQFSREYKRYFGVPPSRHLRALRPASGPERPGLAAVR